MTNPTELEVVAVLKDLVKECREHDGEYHHRTDQKLLRRAADMISNLYAADEQYPFPRYRHDCPACVFLGRFKGSDLYWCGKQGPTLPTLVARFGNEGKEYTSGIGFTGTDERIHRAHILATARFLPVGG